MDCLINIPNVVCLQVRGRRQQDRRPCNHFNSEQDPYEVEVVIEQVIPHEEYSDSTYSNDIMLLKLAEPVQMNDGVSPVCLPALGEDYTTALLQHWLGPHSV